MSQLWLLLIKLRISSIQNISEYRKFQPSESRPSLNTFKSQLDQIRVIHLTVKLTQNSKKSLFNLVSKSLIYLSLNRMLIVLFKSYKHLLRVRISAQSLSLSQLRLTHWVTLNSHSSAEYSLSLLLLQCQSINKLWWTMKEQIKQTEKQEKIRVSSELNNRSLLT